MVRFSRQHKKPWALAAPTAIDVVEMENEDDATNLVLGAVILVSAAGAVTCQD
jgi:hypothetical protein